MLSDSVKVLYKTYLGFPVYYVPTVADKIAAAVTTDDGEKYVEIYDLFMQSFTSEAQEAILAHEVAHLELEHENVGIKEEHEADVFAASIVGNRAVVVSLLQAYWLIQATAEKLGALSKDNQLKLEEMLNVNHLRRHALLINEKGE